MSTELILPDLDSQAVALPDLTWVADTGLGALWRMPKLLLLRCLSHTRNPPLRGASKAPRGGVGKAPVAAKIKPSATH